MQNLLKEKRHFKASQAFIDKANVKDLELFNLAQQDYLAYWQQQAEQLHWSTPFKEILTWEPPYASWFRGGELNLSYNCLDRHMPNLKDKVAFYWQGELGVSGSSPMVSFTSRCKHVLMGLRNWALKRVIELLYICP